jgi:hypothetical protein
VTVDHRYNNIALDGKSGVTQQVAVLWYRRFKDTAGSGSQEEQLRIKKN